jgi:hypothetical protein
MVNKIKLILISERKRLDSFSRAHLIIYKDNNEVIIKE